MTTFVIRTDDERDLGFLMFAGHDGDWPPAGANDCVFSGFPHDPALLDDPRGRLVMEAKGEEHSAEISYTDEEMTVRIPLPTGWTFDLRSNEAGNRWTAERAGERIEGTGMFL